MDTQTGVFHEDSFRHLLTREAGRATRYQDFFSVCILRPDVPGDRQQIGAEIEQVAFREGPEGRPQRLTVSVGKVSFPHDGHTDSILLSQALAYLEQATQRGGNQVTHSTATPD